MRIIVLGVYYNRPILFRKALESLKVAASTHPDWEAVIGDDNSPNPAEPIVREVFGDQVKVFNSNTTREEKANGIGRIGALANQAILASKADIGIFLCDDDLLMPNYFKVLSEYYSTTPAMYGYCDIAIYNPLKPGPASYSVSYNKDVDDPVNHLDASQVSFRLDAFRKYGVAFPENAGLVENLDAAVLRQMYQKFGKPDRINTYGQIKGVHDYQMMWNKKKDITEHLKHIDSLAGKVF